MRRAGLLVHYFLCCVRVCMPKSVDGKRVVSAVHSDMAMREMKRTQKLHTPTVG
jgi:hypothetical protein